MDTAEQQPSNRSSYNISLQPITDLNIEDNTVIHICSYRIINTELYPFLMYLLHKNPLNDVFNFPTFKYNSSINPVSYSETILYGLLNFNKLVKNEKQPECDYNAIFKGALLENNELFLFFDSTNCENNIYDIYKKNKIWYGLMDEIIHKQHICNLQIDDAVTMFFMNNPSFIYLKDEYGLNYEMPIVAYSGQPDNKLNFTYVFGVTKKTEEAGTHYYFTDYNNSIKEGGWSLTNKPEFHNNTLITENSHGKYIKGGIVRFAIFLGNLSTEYDANWSDTYDSVYIDKLNTPYWVLKNYAQQMPLSYHYINKNKLGETFQENETYLIM